MEKKKVQTIIFYCAQGNIKHFLLLQTNQRRGNFWQNVTGSVDAGESFEAAALREAMEETGITEDNIINLQTSKFEFHFFDQWKKNVIEKVFVLQCKEPWKIVLDPSEHSSFKWIEEKEIHQECVKFESNFLPLKSLVGARP